ncbi:hypothetical protein SEA_FORK_69 [Microbacterium phage Fork]|nr:hypothetical protein SEA_FORK_69 [Microbacterium phage Fork]QYC54192.1 hypothetical protein SEA_WELCOME_75 [Microbacterium phage Welcome]
MPESQVSDGKVQAIGSVWKIHYTEGKGPEDSEVARTLSALGVVKAERVVTTNEARITPNNI